MTIIASISGIRWTIWWKVWENLTPVDIVKFTSAYWIWLQKNFDSEIKIVVWKDARLSWEMVENLVVSTLIGMWISVIQIWLATTPTTEIAVVQEKAQWWIIITASHNPEQRNALKLLNSDWEFLNDIEWNKILEFAKSENFNFAEIEKLWKIEQISNYEDVHIQKIIDLELVKPEKIRQKKFKIVVDWVNSVGWVVIPKLLKALWVEEIIELYCEPTGKFPHNPEPLPENLRKIQEIVKSQNADLWIVVDPDVDRLAFVCENGALFGEEYTLVAVADYILQYYVGSTVSNYLSSRALRDISQKYGWAHRQCSVWEVNVVEKMKKIHAIIGGEWNGGIIYPQLHYGRDALVGVALFLSFLAEFDKTASEVRQSYPNYEMTKTKFEITNWENPDKILEILKQRYKNVWIHYTENDGVRVEFEDSRVHVRKSNTEPIIRVYAEWKTKERADQLTKATMWYLNQS